MPWDLGVDQLGNTMDAARRTLPPRPSSVGEARRLVSAALREADREDLVETAELLVSEVVTNALVHAGTDIDIVVNVDDAGARVEVGDGSPHLPCRRNYGPTAGTGRGLSLLAQLVDDWGIESRPGGKCIWFRITDTEPVEAAFADFDLEGLFDDEPDADMVHVQLVDTPVLLAHAWHQHAENLLREHLLATLENTPDAIQVHAHATDALALVFEHVPPIDVDGNGEEVLAAGEEYAASSPTIVLPVPPASVANFAVLDEALEDAVALADAGHLLTYPTQPELRLLRRWLCRQVAAQHAGQQPTPWQAVDNGPPPANAPLEWDSAEVTTATLPLLAADDTNQILAVSPAALDVLGYDTADELVGGRLLSIIPARFHEAHLAGFTLHFLTGRAPLIDQTVRVPARRRDGSEVEVDLTIHPVPAPHGRRLFVAELRPAS